MKIHFQGKNKIKYINHNVEISSDDSNEENSEEEANL